MSFWLLDLSSLQAEVVAAAVVVERPPMQVVVLRQMQEPTCAVVVVEEVPVESVEENPALYPLGCSHKYVRHVQRVPHRWDSLKTFAVQSPQ